MLPAPDVVPDSAASSLLRSPASRGNIAVQPAALSWRLLTAATWSPIASRSSHWSAGLSETKVASACLHGVRDLFLDERRPDVAGANTVAGDLRLGEFEYHGLGQAGDAVLGRDIGSGACERSRSRKTDAACRAGHERRLTLQDTHVVHPVLARSYDAAIRVFSLARGERDAGCCR